MFPESTHCLYCGGLVWLLLAGPATPDALAFFQNADNESDSVNVGEPARNAEDAIRFALTGMQEEMSRLTSGVCHFTGKFESRISGAPEKNLTGATQGLIAIEGGKVRFDITRPGWIIDPTTIRSADDPDTPGRVGNVTAKTKKGILTKRFADDGIRVTVWNSNQPMIAIAQTRDFPDVRSTGYIDIRGITLFDRLSINKGLSLDQIFDNFSEHYSKLEQSIEKIDESKWILNWLVSDEMGSTKWSLTVDIESGFMPQVYQCESAPVKDVNQDDKWILEWRNKTEWKQVNGAWVPVFHEFYTPSSPFSKIVERTIFHLAWENVNAEIDDQLFTYKTFEVPDDVAIQDASGSDTVWIKPFPGSSPPAAVIKPARDMLRTVLVVLNLLIIALLVAWYLFRRARQ